MIIMKRVYECDLSKKKDLLKILEADKFATDSLERIGYKFREGASLGEDKSKIYIYVSSSEENIKKADEKLKPVATVLSGEKEKKILDKISAEDEGAEAGFGSMFS